MSIDLINIVANILADRPEPIAIEDNTGPLRISHDPIAMACASPPAYKVLVTVNWRPGYRVDMPWVAVTHTERFGFTPVRDGYSYLTPPDGLQSDDAAAIDAWLSVELPRAVEVHAPRAAAAKAADAGTPGPVEAWDAIRRLS